MLKLVMMITIVKRNLSENLLSFFNNNKVPMTYGRYGRGTATDAMLDYLGVDEKEKCISFSVLPVDMFISLNKKLNSKFKDSYSFAIPISSVGGKNTMEHFEKELSSENATTPSNHKFNNELILVITNRGYVDLVMDAARKAGAPGGTVIHARGTGVGDSEKFFGVTVGAEKEMIFIVTDKSRRDKIMQAIMKDAGNDSPAASTLFSLPVLSLGNN